MKTTLKNIVTKVLILIAKGILRRTNPHIIAITGSVGKTSTKDAIYTVLKGSGSVRRSEKSFNSELGVPLSIIGATSGWNNPLRWLGIIFSGIGIILRPKNYPKTLVLEVGADRPGDIASIAKWLRPHVVVITRLPDIPVHIEFFPTLESVIEEKLSLAKYMRKEGTLVINADDARIMEAKEKLHLRTTTFGKNPSAMLVASDIQILAPTHEDIGGLTYKLNFDGKSLPVTLPNIYAESFVTVSLAALSVAYTEQINMVDAIASLATYRTPPGRVRIIRGINDTVLIDDTYNSSPAAVEAGLCMLRDLPFGTRKVAIIGDMLELGKHTQEAHHAAGKLARKCSDVLITVGLRSKEIAASALEARMSAKRVFQTMTAKEAGELMQGMICPGDIIFIKGSQGMRMEETVKMLMAEPERAGELLVRQDKEWVS